MSQENVEVVRAAADAFAAGDIDAVETLYTPDATISAVPDGWPEPAPVVGRNAVMLQFIRLQEDWEEHSLRVERIHGGADWVAVAFRWQTRGASSGMTLNTNIAAAYRVKDGKISDARFFWKWEDAVQAAGLSE